MADGSNQMGPTQAAVHEILRQLIQQNNTRDQQVMNILENIASQRAQPVLATGTIPNLNATIGTFDGESDDAGHAQGWISSLETTALLNQWPDLYKLEAARSHLTGAARNWYLARQSEIETWAKFKEQFEQMFTTAISVSEQWKRLQARTQQRNETVYAYFHDKMPMCRQLKLSKSESKKLMCMGLHSKDMCNVLMSRTHNEEYEVLQDLRECDEVFQSRNERFKSTSNSKSTLSKEENFKIKLTP
ncbi:unnamed protein product [Macrosiphum euphorbiae]|uniref:Ty3 transposon capsid-like protein domain-containing protein n=2 Tax=Macrosiphum euphorbiae TaxID=13131 RepID=A0AAV0WE84_9HEMI|nr:unnamed protein product [Macrosiphum euphorbiae]